MEWPAVFANLLELRQPQYIFVAVLSLLVPLSIFVGRRYVRVRRSRLLKSLQDALNGMPAGSRSYIEPQLRLMHARYAVSSDHRSIGFLKELGSYVLPVTIFVMLSALGFGLMVRLGGEWAETAGSLLRGLRGEDGGPAEFAEATGLVVGAGFLGAYVWSIKYLILRITNVDLQPLSFLRVSQHLLMTVFVVWVLRHVAAEPDPAGQITGAGLLLLAFLAGLYPGLGLKVLVDRLPRKFRVKREAEGVARIAVALPLDLIDGIDPAIKFRLNQLEIVDVQNLATVSPLVLYLESPYGLFEIVDWIAQAQLLTELGPDGYVEARSKGVRDMLSFLATGDTPAGRQFLASVLKLEGTPSDDLARVKWESISKKLHVQYLRHWWSVLSHAPEDALARSTTRTPPPAPVLAVTGAA